MAYSTEVWAVRNFQERTTKMLNYGMTRKCACCKKDTTLKPGYRNKPVYICADCNLKGRVK